MSSNMLKRILHKHFLERLVPVIGGSSGIVPSARCITRPLNVPGSILNKYRLFLSRLYFRKETDRWRFPDLAMEFALPFIIMKKTFSRVSQKIIRQSNSLAYIFKNYQRQDRPIYHETKAVSPQTGETGKPFFAGHPLYANSFRQVVYKNIGMKVIERSQRSAQTLAGNPKSASEAEYKGRVTNLQFQTPARPAAVQDMGDKSPQRVDITGAMPSQAVEVDKPFLSPLREDASIQSPVGLKYQRFNRGISGNRIPENLRRNSFQYSAPGSLLNLLTQNSQRLQKSVTDKFSRSKNVDMAPKSAQNRTLPDTEVLTSEPLHLRQNINLETTTILTHKTSEKQDFSEAASASRRQKPADSVMIPGHPANRSAETIFTPMDAEPAIKLARPPGISDPRTSMLNGEAEVSRIADAVYTLIEKKLRVERERRGIFF